MSELFENTFAFLFPSWILRTIANFYNPQVYRANQVSSEIIIYLLFYCKLLTFEMLNL